jgi:hypothetical protein
MGMKILAKKMGKSDRHDRICCIRADGSVTEALMPRQGIAPHDLLHYLVETRMAFVDGFLGMMAKGADISFVMQQSHDMADGSNFVQAAQAEAMVESLQAQLWSGVFDGDAFHSGLEAACLMRGVPPPEWVTVDIENELFQSATRLSEQWVAQPFHSEMTLVFG